ncbi:hypothetical protein MYIN104542_24270 [Mycobacterium intermedium]
MLFGGGQRDCHTADGGYRHRGAQPDQQLRYPEAPPRRVFGPVDHVQPHRPAGALFVEGIAAEPDREVTREFGLRPGELTISHRVAVDHHHVAGRQFDQAGACVTAGMCRNQPQGHPGPEIHLLAAGGEQQRARRRRARRFGGGEDGQPGVDRKTFGDKRNVRAATDRHQRSEVRPGRVAACQHVVERVDEGSQTVMEQVLEFVAAQFDDGARASQLGQQLGCRVDGQQFLGDAALFSQ